jgi:hypothetical protein
MVREWVAEKGYLTFAFNTKDTNYLELAYRLAESIKATQKHNNISVIIDSDTAERIKTKHTDIFDRIMIKGKASHAHKDFAHQALAWDLTPYKQTIKIEADMYMTSSIDHWWSILDERDVCLTTSVFDHTGELITDRSQRRMFDDNDLPNVYNAITYFRYTKDSKQFFDIVKRIHEDWEFYKNTLLKNCRYERPVTDEVFAIAARIYGEERCTLPFPVPAFLHMKNPLLGLPNDGAWWEYLYVEGNRIGHYAQKLPVHYNKKDYWDGR